MDRRGLERLTDAMGGVRSRDAAALKEALRRLEALDAARAALATEIETVRAGLADNDLEQMAGFERWRANRRRRLRELDGRRELLQAQEELCRQALLRSNGELEAVHRLVAASAGRRRSGAPVG